MVMMMMMNRLAASLAKGVSAKGYRKSLHLTSDVPYHLCHSAETSSSIVQRFAKLVTKISETTMKKHLSHVSAAAPSHSPLAIHSQTHSQVLATVGQLS